MTRTHPRRATADKLRRRTGGALDLDRPVADQRVAFASLLELTEVAMPEHRCRELELGGRACLELEPQTRAPLADAPLILFVHGGGYSLGSPRTHRPLAARIARVAGARVILPSYRRAPEHPCPAGIDDVLAVWRALEPAARARAVLVGDSAGGGLCLAVTMRLRELGEAPPLGLALLSPWVDLTMSGASIEQNAAHEIMLRREGLELMAGRYAGSLPRKDPRVSPLFGNFEGLPPMLIHVGELEVLLDDARRLAARAREAGVEVQLEVWPEQHHVFQATPLHERASAAVTELGDWIRARA